MAESRPVLVARLAGFFYLGTFVAGSVALAMVRGREAADIVASVCYIAVVLLFYRLFKPVSPGLSLLAAMVGLAGCSLSIVVRLGVVASHVNPLAVFGCYCLLIGYLILRSMFLPKFVGVLMGLGGVGWLTFASAALARRLAPFNFLPGVVGEGVLTLWLLIAAVKEDVWKQRSLARGA